MRYYFVQYWEKAEFPFHVVPKLAALRIAGGTIKVLYTLHVLFLFICGQNYGTWKFNQLGSSGLWVPRSFRYCKCYYYCRSFQGWCELFYFHFGPFFSGNAYYWWGLDISWFFTVDSVFIAGSWIMTLYNLCGWPRIALCGSEAQKQKYLPSLAQLNTIACWVSSSLFGHCMDPDALLISAPAILESLEMFFYTAGFNWAWLWKWCKFSENNSNKGPIHFLVVADWLLLLILSASEFLISPNIILLLCHWMVRWKEVGYLKAKSVG